MPTPGIVTTIRVNPPDVMAVLDTLDYLGMSKDNISFAEAVKIVLAAGLEAYRQQGFIPRREGFEYSTMLDNFRGSFGARAERLRLTKESNMEAFTTPNAPDADTPERRTQRIRFNELMFKRGAAPESLTQKEKHELLTLIPLFQ